MNKRTIRVNKNTKYKNERRRILISITKNTDEKFEIWKKVNNIHRNIVQGGSSQQYKKTAVDIMRYLNDTTSCYECEAGDCSFNRSSIGTSKEQASNKRSFCKHILDHEKPFMECPYKCSYSTKVKASLVQHIQRKHSLCKYKCPARGCDISDNCSMYGNIATHYGRKHINKKYLTRIGDEFKCTKCDFSNKSQGRLYIHLAKCVGPFKDIGSGGSRKCQSIDMRKETRLVMKV